MPDQPSDNFWKSTQEPPPNSGEAPLAAPPPPPEVKVRTLRSDLESMAKSGGGLPQFQAVRAPSLIPAAAAATAEKGGKKALATAVIVLVALALLGAIVYFAYQLFFKQSSPANTTPPVPQSASQPVPQPQALPSPAAVPPLAAQSFVHHSLFSKPVDQLLTLTVRSSAESASDLQTFSQKVTNLLAGAKPTTNLFEINVKNADGEDLDVNETMALADTAVLDPQFLSAHFNTDATFFVYSAKGGSASGGKDKNGLWPGYIVALKPTENWLFLKNDIQKLEKSSKVNNFFFSSPGDRVGDFKDDVVSGQPVRVLQFTAPGAIFIYGWFRGNLILSVSLDGLKSALARLQ